MMGVGKNYSHREITSYTKRGSKFGIQVTLYMVRFSWESLYATPSTHFPSVGCMLQVEEGLVCSLLL